MRLNKELRLCLIASNNIQCIYSILHLLLIRKENLKNDLGKNHTLGINTLARRGRIEYAHKRHGICLRVCLIEAVDNIAKSAKRQQTQKVVQNLETTGKTARRSTEHRTVHHVFSDLLENMQHGGAYYLNFKSFSLVMNKVNFQVVAMNKSGVKDLSFL